MRLPIFFFYQTQLRKNEVQRLIQTLASTRAERDSLCAEAAHLAEVVSKQTNRQTQLLRALERLEPIRNIDFRSNKPIPKPAAPAAAAASAAVETDSSKPTKEEESARSKAAAKTQKGKPKGPKPKKEKKGKGAAKPAGSNNANSSASLPIAEIDIRVGEIIKVWEHPDSEKLWCESINCGEVRRIAFDFRETHVVVGIGGFGVGSHFACIAGRTASNFERAASKFHGRANEAKGSFREAPTRTDRVVQRSRRPRMADRYGGLQWVQ